MREGRLESEYRREVLTIISEGVMKGETVL
jgi:hypothetical protein